MYTPTVISLSSSGSSRRTKWRLPTLLAAGALLIGLAAFALTHRTTAATWYLPGDYVADPSSSTLQVLVLEVGCSSGKGAAGNIARPRVTVTNDSVTINVRTYVRYGAQNCQGSTMAPLEIDIGVPLGARKLIDANGSVVPEAKYRFPYLTIPEAG